MARSGSSTRASLLEAAEVLFAERGIDAVAVSEITALAGARNNSAVAYHFGSRLDLLEAVLLPHYADVDRRRDEILDRVLAADDLRIETVAEALVAPPASKLADPSGVRYLQIQAHLLGYADRDALPEEIRWPWARPSLRRLRRIVVGAVAPDAVVSGALAAAPRPPTRPAGGPPDHRWVLVSGLVLHGLADHSRAAPLDDADRQAFVDALTNSVVAVLAQASADLRT